MARIYETPIFDVTGLEIVRGDWSPIAKNLQKKIIIMILDGRSIEDIINKIDEYKKVVDNQELKFDEIVISQRINCSLDRTESVYDKDGNTVYNKDGTERKKSVPQHVKIAKMMVDNGEDVVEGQLIEYVYDAEKGIVPVSMYSGKYCAETYWRQKIFPPTYRIVTSVFPEYDWDTRYIKRGKKKDKEQKELDFFFKKK